MRPYLLAALAICALLLALFGLAHLLEIPLLGEEQPDLAGTGAGAAAASFALLAGDVVLPVPSSALMILNGSLFGPLGGALLSLAATSPAYSRSPSRRGSASGCAAGGSRRGTEAQGFVGW